jgi:hypothetical protein
LVCRFRKDAKLTAIGKVRPANSSQAKAARGNRAGGDGLANAIICIAFMLACVIAYIVLAPR